MNKNMLVLMVMIFGIMASCKSQDQSKQPNLKSQSMKNYISIFEIPATDIPRAVKFYKGILTFKLYWTK